mmetsp:Transcript_98827/g.282557  ORF Transcript_98827/g.282557 Transcript_98827/m.282557 type:complete len:273 (-) Transcript_98827:106-924(-)
MQCMMHWTGAGKVVGPGKAMGHFGSHNQLNKLSDKWKEPKEAQKPDVNGGGTKVTKPTMFCHHPHGVVAIGPCSMGSKLGNNPRAVVAPACLSMPFCRQMMECLGMVSSSRPAMKKTMREGKDLAIIPGGVEEVVLASSKVERSYITKRKGFVKYALQHGYDLVYHLGETSLFDVVYPLDTPVMLKARVWLANKFSLATGVGFGWPFLPLVPKPDMKCVTVVGNRIAMPTVEEPSREMVEKHHAMYVEALQRLYYEHRALHPLYQSRALELW